VIISFFAFFEEIGWRGYMLPKLEIGCPRLAPALVGLFARRVAPAADAADHRI
jgi:membrane protease YdiL (CAAX protease family)